MATLKELRYKAHLTIAELARLAGIDRKTVERAEAGVAISDLKAYQILEVLREKLDTGIKISDIDGLNVR
ncbi:MAG: helix-turn-helix domain-containing protein [Ktedonobacteraceae bacterium]